MSKKAIISVSDKSGIVEFARKLKNLGYDIVSTGGTFKILKEAGLDIIGISELTGFPEIMNGRVKTLHPKVHGGILGVRDNEEHVQEAEKNGIEFIDLVVVNLYPFKNTILKEGVLIDEAIENIDIGGPTMLRSSAKNYKYVTVVTDPEDYDVVINEIKENENTSLETRERLALKVFTHTADYDSTIQKYLAKQFKNENRDFLFLNNGQKLRYGENSHQNAEFYALKGFEEANLGDIEICHGKELSYNNYVDADASLEVVKDLGDVPAVSIIKHSNPCGFATGDSLKEAFNIAWQGDVVSSYGSVITFNKKVDLDTAKQLKGKFVEVVMAPNYDDDALEFLKAKSKNLRIIKIKGDYSKRDYRYIYKNIIGGVLRQDRDVKLWEKFDVVTKKSFEESKMELAKFTWIATKHTKSNAIVLGYEYAPDKFMVIGMGAGQPNRVDSLRKLAATKATENLERMYDEQTVDTKGMSKKEFIKNAFGNMVLGSDAFFPFADTIDECDTLNIKYIVQPGGSIRDNEVVEACDKYKISMVYTGTRHFRH